MPLLNYTTKVAVDVTVGQIQKILASHGATAIMLKYDAGELVGMSFRVDTTHGNLPFSFPVDIAKVQAVLGRQNQHVDEARAARIGWRILKDWTEAQMALLETEMVELEEIFMPYLMVNESETMYHRMVASGYQLALEEGREDGS